MLLHDGHIAADGTFEELKGQNETGTLETIFNSLTGFDAHEQTARKFVDAVTGGEAID